MKTATQRMLEMSEEIEKKATPGDWQTHDSHSCYYVSNGKGGKFAAFDNRICELAYPYGREERRRQDLDLIAHARNTMKQKEDMIMGLYEALKEQEKAINFAAHEIGKLNIKIHGDLHGCDCESACDCKPALWYDLESIKYHCLGGGVGLEEALESCDAKAQEILKGEGKI